MPKGQRPIRKLATLLLLTGTALFAQTFTKDVAPILQSKCQDCHRTGAMAPMAFETYEQTRPWAKSIRERVVRR